MDRVFSPASRVSIGQALYNWVVRVFLIALSVLSGCAIDDLDSTGKTCPCASGWECDTTRNVCVEAAEDSGTDASRADSGTEDARSDDAGSEDATMDAPQMDSRPPDTFDAAACVVLGPETCNGIDDDCDGDTDEGFPVGNDCSVGVGECERSGSLICDALDSVDCDASPGSASTEVCNTLDDDCDGDVDESGCVSTMVYATCAEALAAGETTNGVYQLRPEAGPLVAVRCDMSTDGGGWTLVASTESRTLNDQASDYYVDLSTLAPDRGHSGVWDGLRDRAPRFDVRFACRDDIRSAGAPFTVDLSFYDVTWYGEWTAGDDEDSCFSESDGRGADIMAPARRNNLTGIALPFGDPFNAAGYLEGEDDCEDDDDFTVDFDDRGMDSDEGDGTDWGEDDGDKKCGESELDDGQWFIFVRET